MPRKKITKTKKKETKKTAVLNADIYNMAGEVVGKANLPPEIFSVKVHPQLIAQAVRVYQTNLRAGTHDTKTRSEVAGSTRKIYRQKGTGRARHGAITAPIFIGGGIAHGPHPKDYGRVLPQKMKRLALFGVLADKLKQGEIKIIRGLSKIDKKTQKMHETLVNMKFGNNNNKSADTLLVTAQDYENLRLASRNLKYLFTQNAKLLNAFEVLNHKNILLMEEAVPILSSHFLTGSVKDKLKTAKITQKKAGVGKKTKIAGNKK